MAADPSSRTSASSTNPGQGAFPPAAGSGGQQAPKQRTFAPKQILATVLIVLAVVLGLENTRSVNIRLIGPVEQSPLWILVFAPLVLGIVAGFLLGHRSGKTGKRR